jgi:hypothetical protein
VAHKILRASAPIGLLACGAGLLGLAAYGFFLRSAGPGVVLLVEAKREFPVVAAGSTLELSFPLRNDGNRTARIIGLATC